jgi:hypothetical protein
MYAELTDQDTANHLGRLGICRRLAEMSRRRYRDNPHPRFLAFSIGKKALTGLGSWRILPIEILTIKVDKPTKFVAAYDSSP